MKKSIIISILLLISCSLFSQGIYNNGAKIVVGSGVTMYLYGTGGSYRAETNVNDASIDLAGTLKIQGNLINNIAANDVFNSISTGSEVAFIGTTSQTVGGSTISPFTFSNLTIDNLSGIILSKNTFVNGSMKFTNGLVDIGNNDFTFGPLSLVTGSPSFSSMIIATGTGMVYREWTVSDAFIFPVGDNNAIAEYLPVSLTFTSGNFGPGAIAGVSLINSKYNDPAIAGSFLNRYWIVGQTGITGFSADALFNYEAADVVGTESAIYTLSVNPAPFITYDPANTVLHQLTATGLTSLGTYTGGPGTPTGIEDLYSNNSLVLSNYPNPFSGNTTILYNLPSDGHVTLTILTLDGQILKTIISRMETKGENSLIFDAGGLKSGIYLATLSLRSNGKEIHRSIIMVKGR